LSEIPADAKEVKKTKNTSKGGLYRERKNDVALGEPRTFGKRKVRGIFFERKDLAPRTDN